MHNLRILPDTGLPMLYAMVAVLLALLATSHYLLGLYELMLITLIAVPVLLFAAVYLRINHEDTAGDLINPAVIGLLAALMVYQLPYAPEITLQWSYSLPVFAFLVLPMRMASMITLVLLLTLAASLFGQHLLPPMEALRGLMILLLLGICTWCYANINSLHRRSLRALAVNDYASGAFNRTHLKVVLDQEIARSYVTHRTLSLIAITLEDHQQIIEIHGASSSRQLLHNICQQVRNIIRAGDEIFHDGKGTFYLLLPNCQMDGAVILKERISRQLGENQWGQIGELNFTTGIATLNEGEDSAGFMQRAAKHLLKMQSTALRLVAFSQ
jgi:diguanylate cyclase (GGDEF)-like protein